MPFGRGRTGRVRRQGWLGLLGAGLGFLALLFLLAGSGASPAEGAFQADISRDQGLAGSTVRVTVDYDGSLGELSGFLIEAGFDPAWTLTKPSGDQEGYLYDSGSEGGWRWVYIRQEGSQGMGPGRVLDLELRLAKDAPPGQQ